MKLLLRSTLITVFMTTLYIALLYFLAWSGTDDITEFCVSNNFELYPCDNYEIGDQVLIEKHVDSRSADAYLDAILVSVPAIFIASILSGLWGTSKTNRFET